MLPPPKVYSIITIDFTISVLAIERRGIAVAIKQAMTETAAASKMEIIGTVPNVVSPQMSFDVFDN